MKSYSNKIIIFASIITNIYIIWAVYLLIGSSLMAERMITNYVLCRKPNKDNATY